MDSLDRDSYSKRDGIREEIHGTSQDFEGFAFSF